MKTEEIGANNNWCLRADKVGKLPGKRTGCRCKASELLKDSEQSEQFTAAPEESSRALQNANSGPSGWGAAPFLGGL